MFFNKPVCVAQQRGQQSSDWLRYARRVSGSDFRFLFEECHINRCYEASNVSIRPGGIVIDIGSNIGMFSTRAAEALGQDGLVIAVEPSPNAYEVSLHNIKAHREYSGMQNIAKVKVLQCAVSNGSTKSATFVSYPRAAGWSTLSEYDDPNAVALDMQFFLDNSILNNGHSDNSYTILPLARYLGILLHSVSEEAYAFACRAAVRWLQGGKRKITVPVTTVSNIIESYVPRNREVDLLKIDVERAELQVLQSIRTNDWPKIRQISMELHEENVHPVRQILIEEGQFDDDCIDILQSDMLKGTSIFMCHCWR